jgi:hypothetical protein
LSHNSNPFCSGYFGDRVSLFAEIDLDYNPPILNFLLFSWDGRHCDPDNLILPSRWDCRMKVQERQVKNLADTWECHHFHFKELPKRIWAILCYLVHFYNKHLHFNKCVMFPKYTIYFKNALFIH